MEIQLAVDELQKKQEESKVVDVVTQYKDRGYSYEWLLDNTFMITAPSGKTDNSA